MYWLTVPVVGLALMVPAWAWLLWRRPLKGLCKDCKWAVSRSDDWHFARCTHPKTQSAAAIDPVTGELEAPRVPCWGARHALRRCGPSGRLWEAREPTPPPFPP
jgi:hypothetical protein